MLGSWASGAPSSQVGLVGGKSPVGRVIDIGPCQCGQNRSQRLLGGPKPSSRLGQRAQRSTVQCPSARRFQSRLSCFVFAFSRPSPVFFFFYSLHLFSTGSCGPHSFLYKRTRVFSFLGQLRPFAFSSRHDFSGGPAFMTLRPRLSRPSRATDRIPQSNPTSHEPCA